jgi:aspartate kinase
MSDFAVVKFGGISVKNIARIQHVASIIKGLSQTKKVLAVISAMGDTTDFLVKLSRQASENPDTRELDLLLATGEQVSIALLSMVLKDMQVRARSLTANQLGIFTETVHTRARIVEINSQRLVDDFQTKDVLVVAGFQGVTPDGDITTLGRGGSDTTAVALAAAIGADECDIYTDVDGIFTADPNQIKDAQLLEHISYEEVLEMARLGAQVLHPRAVELARQYGVTLRVRNTFKPDNPGTTIEGGNMEIFRSISGVAVDVDQCTVAIMDVPDIPGIAGKVTQALADQNIAMDMIVQSFHPSAGVNSMTFAVFDGDLAQTIKILDSIKSQLGAKEVIADPDCAKVSLIGAGLCGQPWIPALMFSTLGANSINIKMISSSEMKIACVVSRAQAQQAARLIHDAFKLSS